MKKVEILNIWISDYDDICCNAILYKNNSSVANIIVSYDESEIRYNIGDKASTLDEDFVKDSLMSLIYDDFDEYLRLPKVTECSKLLIEIYDGVCSSDSSMCHIDEDDWKNFYSEKFKKEDIEKLQKEIIKYNLGEVITINEGEYLIIGYGDLQTRFNDDRNLDKESKSRIDNDDLSYIRECVDFPILNQHLNECQLKHLNNVLKEFIDYQHKYDTGDNDIISEYENKYGNSNIIDWYEGMKATKSFLEDFFYEEMWSDLENAPIKENITESEIITSIDRLDDKHFYTVARIINNTNCVELHYNEGEATVEYGEKISDSEWENTIQDAKWFNRSMTNEEMIEKLEKLFDEYEKNDYTI